ncbi:MAG: AMP-dependent synthetase/ligase [Rhodospirillales bacterium]
MSNYAWPNLAAMFYTQAADLGDRPFLWEKSDGAYKPLSWGDTAARVSQLARGLQQLGVKPGDRVVLVSENRANWLIADMAVMTVGAVTTPAYVTNNDADHLHILEDSEAVGAIVSTKRLADRLFPAAHRADTCKFVVTMEDVTISQSLNFDLHTWDDVLASGMDSHDNMVELANRWGQEDTACIIYTSGTGGKPKGVVLPHRALFHNIEGATDALRELGLGSEVFLSFLPLSHSYEHMAGQFFPMSIGAEIYYAEGIEHLVNNMAEARPTIMTAVPRLYESMRARIERGVEAAGGAKEKMFRKALALGTKQYLEPGSLGVVERLQDTVLDKLVRAKVKKRFGGRLKALVSGGAPLNPDVGIYFTALGLCILQGYGQTESAPLISVNRPSKIKMHTVGPAVKNTEVKIAQDGEIVVRGDLVMTGYWRNDDATGDAVKDGWLHTGDIGHLDDDGYLVITDRKKDIIVNSGGDNIAPQRVEGIITLEPEFAQATVFGDKRPHLVALLVPDADWLTDWARKTGKSGSLSDLADDADLHKALSSAMERINAKLNNIEKVRRFIVADEPFSVDNEQMTPTLKVRRHIIRQVYGDRLESLYS